MKNENAKVLLDNQHKCCFDGFVKRRWAPKSQKLADGTLLAGKSAHLRDEHWSDGKMFKGNNGECTTSFFFDAAETLQPIPFFFCFVHFLYFFGTLFLSKVASNKSKRLLLGLLETLETNASPRFQPTEAHVVPPQFFFPEQ